MDKFFIALIYSRSFCMIFSWWFGSCRFCPLVFSQPQSITSMKSI